MKTEETNTWKPFWFEANQFFGWIRGMDDWQRLRDAYPGLSDEALLDAKQATYGGISSIEHMESKPNYGFRWEHDGAHTLRDFFADNDMKLEQ